MPRVIEDAMVEPVSRVLLGAIEVDGGATAEQQSVLAAIVCGYWGRGDLDLKSLTPLDPSGAAAVITEEAHRRRVRELMVLLELCRHPGSDAQCRRVDEYATALGESGPGQALARTLVREGAEHALADYHRYLDGLTPDLAEQSLRGRYSSNLAAPDQELATRLRALHDLPGGDARVRIRRVLSAQRTRVAGRGRLHARSVRVPRHVSCHRRLRAHWSRRDRARRNATRRGGQRCPLDAVPRYLGVHEAGFLRTETIVPKSASLTRAGAPALLAEALARGSQCSGDFTAADHLALAEVPLSEVRDNFGVPPLRT